MIMFLYFLYATYSRSNQGNLNYATWPFFLKSLQLVTKNVGTGRNQHDTLYIVLAASIGARQLTFLEWMNESWIHVPIPPTLPYFVSEKTIAQRDQVAHH